MMEETAVLACLDAHLAAGVSIGTAYTLAETQLNLPRSDIAGAYCQRLMEKLKQKWGRA